jgi:hypothetical protein
MGEAVLEPAMTIIGSDTNVQLREAVPDARTAEAKEQAILKGFQAILGHIRQHGLTDEVAVIETWMDHVNDPTMRGEMARLLGFYWLRRQNTEKAVRYSDVASELLPGSTDGPYNAMFALLQAGRWAEVVPRGQAALARFGDMFLWHNILCTAFGRLGRIAEARHHGTRCLELKDAAATGQPLRDLSRVPVPPFDPTRPERNIISFSLFGDNERYMRTAILNARAARFIYIGWTCQFYVDDSVPSAVVQALGSEGARLLKVNGLPTDPFGTFWRFLVADDPEVDRYIVRDADSVVNIRECVAVQEWLMSGRHFHVMRDNFDHGELVLAGMWGGVRAALPPIGTWAQRYLASRTDLAGRTADQEFLRDQVWPTMRTSVLTHDSQFAFGDRRDFPDVGRLPPGCHVGCDGRVMLNLKPAPAGAG